MRQSQSRRGFGAWREYVLTRVRSLEAETFEAAARHGIYVEVRADDDWVLTVAAFPGATVADAEDLTTDELVRAVVAAEVAEPVVAKIGEHLHQARLCAYQKGGITDWISGQRVEGAWFGVHHAEALLVTILTPDEAAARIPDVASAVRAYLPADDPRRLHFERRFPSTLDIDATQRLTPAEQLFVADTLRAAYFLNAVEYSRVRNFRNVLMAATLVMTAIVTCLLLVGSRRPGSVPLCVRQGDTATAGSACPSGEGAKRAQKGGDILLVGLFGLIGAGLAAARSLTTGEEIPTRYSPALAQSVLKLPTGATTGIVGVVALRAGTVPTVSVTTQGSILMWAAVFGFGQQLLTGLIDDRGQQLLTKALPTSPAGPSAPPVPTHRHVGRRTGH